MRKSLLAAALLTEVLVAGMARRADAKPPPAPPRTESQPEPRPPPPLAMPTIEATANGLTADQAGRRTADTNFAARSAVHTARAYSARVDAQKVLYAPRVTLSARYTRLSAFAPPIVDGRPLPQVLDNTSFQASMTVPISDYIFRVSQGYKAAARAEDGAKLDAVASVVKAYTDGKIGFYEWLRARGALAVADASLVVAKAHEKDATLLLDNGRISPSDVLRASTEVSAAALRRERAKATLVIAEHQLLVYMHASADEQLTTGESLDAELAPVSPSIAAFVKEAHARRPEIRSLEKNAEATKQLAATYRATRYPTLSVFGDVLYASPNPRRGLFSDASFFPTWDAGVLFSWTPADVATGGATGADFTERAAALESDRSTQRDIVEMEVTTAYEEVLQGDAAIEVTAQQLKTAMEAYRVARELFINGRTTGTPVIDAEIALAQAQFDHLNARVDARVARARLDYATGRNVH